MSDWAAAVAAARVRQKPLYFVEHKGGGTVECTTSKESAIQYVREAARPHLYKILEQINGCLYEVLA